MVRIWRKRNILPFLVGLQTAMTTIEINMEVPQKFPHRSTWRPCTNLTGEWRATYHFHLMVYYSDFLIYWAMILLLVSIWSLWFSSSSLFLQIFWGTSIHWDLFIPSNPSKLGDFLYLRKLSDKSKVCWALWCPVHTNLWESRYANPLEHSLGKQQYALRSLCDLTFVSFVGFSTAGLRTIGNSWNRCLISNFLCHC